MRCQEQEFAADLESAGFHGERFVGDFVCVRFLVYIRTGARNGPDQGSEIFCGMKNSLMAERYSRHFEKGNGAQEFRADAQVSSCGCLGLEFLDPLRAGIPRWHMQVARHPMEIARDPLGAD